MNDWGIEARDGFSELDLDSWEKFLEVALIAPDRYVFRGQADASWELRPGLQRLYQSGLTPLQVHAVIERQLANFKKYATGKRGPNPLALGDNQWWALGQHYGLKTLLLDWTESPFVALFFAYTAEKETAPELPQRSVWAADRDAINQTSQKLMEQWQRVEFLGPDTDENVRLIAQRGLFSKGPGLGDIETWVKEHFKSRGVKPVLVKLNVPDGDRQRALNALNRMNVNYASLFPDIQGAAWFCNLALELSK